MKTKAIVGVAMALPLAAAAEILVSDGFPIGEGGYAAEKTALNAQAITDESVVGFAWQKWNNGGGSGTVYSLPTGLFFPASFAEQGFTAVGGSIGFNASSAGNPRVGERMLADNVYPSSGKVYLRFLMNADATIAAVNTKPTSANVFTATTCYAAGLAGDWNSTAGEYTYFFTAKNSLYFGVAKNLEDKNEIDLCLIDAAGQKSLHTVVPHDSFEVGTTYLCLAEIDISAGADGKECVRAAAIPVDAYNPSIRWALLDGESATVEVELVSETASPRYFGLCGRYQTNNGTFAVDEVALATKLSDLVYFSTDQPVLESASVASDGTEFTVSAKLDVNRAKLTALASDGVAEEPVSAVIAEEAPEREVVTGTLSGLAANTTYAVSVKAETAAGSDELAAGILYTGTPVLVATEDANEANFVQGTFTVTRADSAHDLAVNYTCGGTAVNGVNYQKLSGTVVIPAGSTSVTIDVLPYLARPHDAATTLTLTLAPGNYIVPSAPQTATITIANLAAPADRNTWVAPEAGLASVASNWSYGRVPESTDDILLDGDYSQAPMTWDVASGTVPATVASWTQKANYPARVTMPTTRSGAFTVMTIAGNAVLDGGEWWRAGNAKADNLTATVWLNLKFGGNLSVGAGFKFNGEASGYPKQRGPSQGGEKGSTGGAHGGLGGGGTYGYGTVYGDYRNPTALGSGQYGGDLGGGGAIVLDVAGDFTLEGWVNADAGDGGTGSGQSGGSVWIKAKTLSGTAGKISADGGSPSNKRAGGGAGRISVQLSDPSWTQRTFAENFTGTIQAVGGFDTKGGDYPRVPGASGTIYIETAGDRGKGTMRLTNSSWGGEKPHNAVTLIAKDVTWDVSSVTMSKNGRMGVAAGGTLHVPSFATITGDASTYCHFAFIGGAVTSDVKRDTLVADGFSVAAYATTDFGAHNLIVPAESALAVPAEETVLTVGSLKLNGVKLAKGTYSAATLAETYANVSGEGTIEVLGLEKGLVVVVR